MTSLFLTTDAWIELVLWAASALVFAAFFMRSIVPLRAIAIASNLAFIVYAVFAWNVPIFFLHAALLPLNIIRIRQHRELIRHIEHAVESDPHIEKLIPLMARQRRKKGAILFKKDDHADAMYFLLSGRIEFPEIGVTIEAGNIFGEMAFFLDDKRRTASAVCLEDCEICLLSEERVKELALTDPAFGLFLTKLIAGRLHNNAHVSDTEAGDG